MRPQLTQCRHDGCARGTNDPSSMCHKHRHLQRGYTRGGQLVFSSGGPLGVAPRLSKEQSVAPPQGDDSMEIEGFPYFSVRDQKDYTDWKIGISPRPSTHDIIDRYPIQVLDIPGGDITGEEIGVYADNGDLYTFAPDSVPQHASALRMFMTESGVPFAVNPQNVYQVVILDRDKLGSHL